MRLIKKTALVAGATGVVGRNLLRRLVSDPDGDVIAVSRRKPDVEGEYRHIAADLLDPADAGANIISSTIKAKQYGFVEVQDSQEMFLHHFNELRAERIIP